jgi:hypothetical protein
MPTLAVPRYNLTPYDLSEYRAVDPEKKSLILHALYNRDVLTVDSINRRVKDAGTAIQNLGHCEVVMDSVGLIPALLSAMFVDSDVAVLFVFGLRRGDGSIFIEGLVHPWMLCPQFEVKNRNIMKSLDKFQVFVSKTVKAK